MSQLRQEMGGSARKGLKRFGKSLFFRLTVAFQAKNGYLCTRNEQFLHLLMEQKQIVGRYKEQQILHDCLNSKKAELIAVYGRRRVGKTFLVKNFFEGQFDFYCTGIYDGTKKEQLGNFALSLHEAMPNAPKARLTDWFEAFEQLKSYLSGLNKEHIVVFIDEMPWFDNHRSRFLKAFEWFWNSW